MQLSTDCENLVWDLFTPRNFAWIDRVKCYDCEMIIPSACSSCPFIGGLTRLFVIHLRKQKASWRYHFDFFLYCLFCYRFKFCSIASNDVTTLLDRWFWLWLKKNWGIVTNECDQIFNWLAIWDESKMKCIFEKNALNWDFFFQKLVYFPINWLNDWILGSELDSFQSDRE